MENQLGGYYKKISLDEWNAFKSPHKIKNDCCPCCFRLLNMIDDDEFNELITNHGIGMHTKELESFFKKKYTEYNFEFFDFDFNMIDVIKGFQNDNIEKINMIKKDKTNQEMIKLSKELKTELTEEVKLKKKELNKQLKEMVDFIEDEYAVLAGSRHKGYSHCLVFFRDTKKPGEKRGQLYILDPQAREMYTDKNDLKVIENYRLDKKVVSFFIMFSIHKENGLPLIIGNNEKTLDPSSTDESSGDFYSLRKNTLTSDYKSAESSK